MRKALSTSCKRYAVLAVASMRHDFDGTIPATWLPTQEQGNR